MARILIAHGSYGCDTGCCGHYVEFPDGKAPDRIDGGWHDFDFDHPYGEEPRAWAEALLRKRYGDEHVKDLDWENSMVVAD